MTIIDIRVMLPANIVASKVAFAWFSRLSLIGSISKIPTNRKKIIMKNNNGAVKIANSFVKKFNID